MNTIVLLIELVGFGVMALVGFWLACDAFKALKGIVRGKLRLDSLERLHTQAIAISDCERRALEMLASMTFSDGRRWQRVRSVSIHTARQ
jgi:hypothetical protein